METLTMIIDFVLIMGMAVLFLLSVVLIKFKTEFSKKLLIVFFGSALFFLLYYYAYSHRSKGLGAIAVLFGNGAGFLLGPFLYYYLKSLVLPKEKIIRALKLHLIPYYIFWLFVSLPVAISMGTGYLTQYGRGYAQIADYINIVENIYFLTYIVIAYSLTGTIKNACQDQYSDGGKNDIRWFKYLTIGFLCIVLLDTFFSLYELFFPALPWNLGTIIAFAIVVLYSLLGYKGLFQERILLPDTLFESQSNRAIAEDKSKEEKRIQGASYQAIDAVEAAEMKQKLFWLLEHKKMYLNESLSLTDLAEEMDTTNKKLSELLNQHLHINFYNLINDYRVATVKEKLVAPENTKYTLLGLAYDSGFPSKASFNRVFKQKTGMSPSLYQKKHLREQV